MELLFVSYNLLITAVSAQPAISCTSRADLLLRAKIKKSCAVDDLAQTAHVKRLLPLESEKNVSWLSCTSSSVDETATIFRLSILRIIATKRHYNQAADRSSNFTFLSLAPLKTFTPLLAKERRLQELSFACP